MTSPRPKQTNQHSHLIEQDFAISTLTDVITLRRVVLSLGHTERVASGLTGWLVALAAGDHLVMSGPTRARYRRILEEVRDSGLLPDGAFPHLFGSGHDPSRAA